MGVNIGNIQNGDNLTKEVYDAIHEIDNEFLIKIGQVNPDVMNVIRGVQSTAFALQYHDEEDSFHLLFVGEKNGAKGFSLIFTFDPESYFYFVLFYSFFLVGEFKYLNPIHVHNTHIHLLRTFFEKEGIFTVTASEKRRYLEKFGPGTMTGPAVYLRDLNEIDFYRELFSFDYNAFIVSEEESYVYLMFHEGNGCFKIGKSKNPLKRERTLQAEQPNIALLKVWKADSALERKLHVKYAKLRKRGEWFALTFKELFELREMAV